MFTYPTLTSAIAHDGRQIAIAAASQAIRQTIRFSSLLGPLIQRL
jgi:hypothetical protein